MRYVSQVSQLGESQLGESVRSVGQFFLSPWAAGGEIEIPKSQGLYRGGEFGIFPKSMGLGRGSEFC